MPSASFLSRRETGEPNREKKKVSKPREDFTRFSKPNHTLTHTSRQFSIRFYIRGKKKENKTNHILAISLLGLSCSHTHIQQTTITYKKLKPPHTHPPPYLIRLAEREGERTHMQSENITPHGQHQVHTRDEMGSLSSVPKHASRLICFLEVCSNLSDLLLFYVTLSCKQRLTKRTSCFLL